MARSSASPDPVADGVAYRRLLLSLCGDDDPAEVQSATPAAIRALVAQAEAAHALRVRPEPGEWSVLECVGHVADAELVMSARYRWTLAHDEPELLGYDQDLWTERLAHNDADPAALLRVFETLREANVALWRAMPGKDRERAGLHLERGRETYGEAFTMIAGHDRFHLDQARRALDAVRGG